MSSIPATTTNWPEIDWLRPDTQVDLSPSHGWYASLKPAFDLLFATLALIPALPIIGICWAIVRLSSPGPGFYSQSRAGKNGKPYRILKLRTMHHNCETNSGIQWSQKGDARVTRFGNFLRKTHLDELPQIFNVLKGEMSLVGPRPERPEVIRGKGLSELVPGYEHRLDVKPGVTGLAQLQLPADTDITSVRHKVVYDLYYIVNQNLWLDLRLMAATGMKAIGVGLVWLRRLYFLPSRSAVARDFRQSEEPPPPPEPHSSAQFQTV